MIFATPQYLPVCRYFLQKKFAFTSSKNNYHPDIFNAASRKSGRGQEGRYLSHIKTKNLYNTTNN